jgi:osmotically-inducible protein OsmY
MKRIPLIAAIGAALMYFLDPADGKRRRHVFVDRVAGFFRRTTRKAERAGRYAGSQAYGLKQKATHLRQEPKPQPDDATLKDKVESELFRDADVPKGQINVNAEHGVVYLRGEVGEPELIETLERRARKIHGVQRVENLLHVPGEPAPTKE